MNVGFVGLGSMGRVLADNLTAAGFDVAGHDTGRRIGSLDDIARAEIVVCSLPDGAASEAVAGALVARRDRNVTHVVDTSTIGVHAAETVAGLLMDAGIGYVDAPVSGGVAGARARTLMVMYAGTDDACAAVELVLAGLSDRRHRVGERPGMGQALKLANNFLSATALAAASEAIAFGASVGLDMATMLEVINAASGQSAATSDKFVNHVLTGRYAAGFSSALMAKDVGLYLEEVTAGGGPSTLASVTEEVWHRFAAAEPSADFTRIHPFVADT